MADGVLGVQAPSNGLCREGHWASETRLVPVHGAGTRSDVTAPFVGTTSTLFFIVCHVSFGVALKLSPPGLRPWWTWRTSAARLDGNPLRVDRFWVELKPSPSGLSWAW